MVVYPVLFTSNIWMLPIILVALALLWMVIVEHWRTILWGGVTVVFAVLFFGWVLHQAPR